MKTLKECFKKANELVYENLSIPKTTEEAKVKSCLFWKIMLNQLYKNKLITKHEKIVLEVRIKPLFEELKIKEH